MTTALFDFRNSPLSTRFSQLSRTLVAKRLDEVVPLLESADAESRAGNYVALMLSYEAAPALDSALHTHNESALPLAWAAVFPEQSRISQIPDSPFCISRWKPAIARIEYDSAIAKIHELIARGDTYQVNYSFPLFANFRGEPLALYRALNLAQGGEYSCFLDLGRYQILSLSPELFFERKGQTVRTKPMKGTVRRGRWLAEDKELASWLSNSAKDRAENVMIVDLLRNDLGKVSLSGSVEVSSLFDVERFETVWQMTSTVTSTLKPNTSLVELMRALFPCGSITGAPKIRTMEIIRELELQSRGIYTGTIGLLQPGGDCVFNVAIRTVVVDAESGEATFGVGGGITIDSTAEGEYDECLVKAKFLNTPPQSFDLFESILLENGQYFLIERHLNRLRNSAEFFGFQFSEPAAISALEVLKTDHPDGRSKVKLTLKKDGSLVTDVSAIEPTKLWRVGLANSPVDSNDRLLFHKTTHREFYAKQVESRTDCDDLLFFNEREELTESSVANVVLKLEGKLVTPPVTAGLLAGTFREQLIVDGEIEERTIYRYELRQATELFLINSVRKWIKAELVEV